LQFDETGNIDAYIEKRGGQRLHECELKIHQTHHMKVGHDILAGSGDFL
jgi:hypothetical protein